MEIPSVLDVLALLVSGVASGFVISFMAEKVGWFQNLTSQAKATLILVLSIGLPVLGQVLLQFVPPTFWDVVQPYWQALAVGFITWMGSQYAYVNHVRPASEATDWTEAERLAAMLSAEQSKRDPYS